MGTLDWSLGRDLVKIRTGNSVNISRDTKDSPVHRPLNLESGDPEV